MNRSKKEKNYIVSSVHSHGSYRINDERKKKRKRRKRILTFLLILLIIGIVGAFFALNFFYKPGRKNIGRITRIGATLNQNITPFGEKIIFYDGATLHCVAATGGNEWSYQIGTNADYDAGEKKVAAWSGNDLYIISSNGRLMYNNKMSDRIQFACAGDEYVAVFIGSADNGVITVINNKGQVVDNIPIENLTLLDIGFFYALTTKSTQEKELIWILGLNTSGTVVSTELMTYEPGRFSTGNNSIGDHVGYMVYDQDGILNVVTTREILHYNFRAIESSPSTLIYGYTMEDVRRVGNTIYQLLVPSSEERGGNTINNIRIMYGDVNRFIHIPANCLTAKLGSRCIYAFSTDAVYVCKYGNISFKKYPLQLNITSVLGMISDNRVIVSSGAEIYVIELPM